jgi:hypothetical protein
VATKPTGPNPHIKKIYWEEMQRRRDKGLCFNCNERYIPGHRCVVTQMFLIEVDPTSRDSGSGENGRETDDDSEEEGVEPQISLYAVAGIYGSPYHEG